MGEQEGLPRPPSGVLPNGLLPNEGASVMRVLDSERWLKAEERTAELIACIQPNPPSEERRNAVADYVKRLVMKCFPCQVFTFGSVPLKTYLPDGDIDLTAFSENQNLKDSWAHQVRDMLEKEEKNENAEFHVKEVQYIQAEVKIIKCLVENIVVDISFNQLGGLCTLCFLDEVDHLINQNHLFKRSVILIKAWCYYESRILGAHHGLISTYALETLVLYIFHVFNNSFAGPLEVLYRFLEFFSKFDWDNFCVSLWGPVPISSLPDVTAKPPRKDGGDLLLSKLFLDACESVYAVWPGGLENHGQSFVSKHFNVIDPLRVNNNLGRSVSKGNFFRIRSAFAFGAKRLSRLFDCPKEDIFPEVNQFFRNTWERHGSGQRPDAPKNNLLSSRLSSPDQPPGSETVRNNTLDQNQKSYGNSRTSEQTRLEVNANHDAHVDRVQRSSKADNFVNDIQGKFFARTQSSPELSDAYDEVFSQPRRPKAVESGKGQVSSTRVDVGRRKNLESDTMGSHGARSDDSSSVRHISSHVDTDDSNSVSNSFHDDSGSAAVGEEFASLTGVHMMNQEEQDLSNIMTSSTAHDFNGQVHFPLGLAPGHVPLPFSPSMLAYAQRNLGNIPLMETPWGANMQFPQGLVTSPLSHYLPGVELVSNPEDSIDTSNGNFSSVEMNQAEGRDAGKDFWHEQEKVSPSEFDQDNANYEMLHSGDRQQLTSSDYSYITSSRAGNSSNSIRSHQKFSRENRRSMTEDRVDNFQFRENRGNGVYFEDRAANSRSSPSASLSSFRSQTSSESSLDGSSGKSSKSIREKRGRKNASSVASATYGKAKNLSELSNQVDDDKREWNTPSTPTSEVTESSGSEYLPHIQVSGHQSAGFEPAQISGSDPLMPIAPVLLGPGSRQRSNDNSGVLPYTFYATGPPVPIFTIPFYKFPTEAGTSETSTSNLNGEEWVDSSESQNVDSLEGFSQLKMSNSSESISRPTAVNFPEPKPDILNSDFLSHWKNLQYGRLCQNSRHAPIICPTPVMVPPVYLQGRFTWDGPGRPVSANMNLANPLMSYGPQLVPVAPLQSVTNRPTSVYQRFADEIPRHRTGTGTYLPNPKPSVRDRHSPGTRRGNYNHDRGDHHGDREGNWNVNSKVRSSGRSLNQNQAERQISRPERLTTSESRVDRPWGSQRNDTFIAYQSQNGPLRTNSSQSNPANMAYGMYALPATNPSGLSSNGPTVPSVVMLYPYDHNAGYTSPSEHLEFGSLGPIGFTNLSEFSQLNEGNRSGGAFDEHSLHSSSAPRSSPDQPSSPHFSRRH